MTSMSKLSYPKCNGLNAKDVHAGGGLIVSYVSSPKILSQKMFETIQHQSL